MRLGEDAHRNGVVGLGRVGQRREHRVRMPDLPWQRASAAAEARVARLLPQLVGSTAHLARKRLGGLRRAGCGPCMPGAAATSTSRALPKYLPGYHGSLGG